LISKKHSGFTGEHETSFNEFYEQFDRQFMLEFNASASVIGSIMAQEIIKVITARDFPAQGFLLYSSE